MEHDETVLAMVRAGRDMTDRQKAVLILLGRYDEPMRQVKALAADLIVNNPSITRAASKLVSAGLAKRSEMPNDRRTCVLTLTAAGMRFVERMAAGFPITTKARKRA